MRVVVDTNVLVSGLLVPPSPPGQTVRLAVSGEISLPYDARILEEYREVLARPRLRIDAADAAILVRRIRELGIPVSPPPWPMALPDPDDAMFLEVALAARAECLATGNLRHFPPEKRRGVRVLPPREFADFYRARGS